MDTVRSACRDAPFLEAEEASHRRLPAARGRSVFPSGWDGGASRARSKLRSIAPGLKWPPLRFWRRAQRQAGRSDAGAHSEKQTLSGRQRSVQRAKKQRCRDEGARTSAWMS